MSCYFLLTQDQSENQKFKFMKFHNLNQLRFKFGKTFMGIIVIAGTAIKWQKYKARESFSGKTLDCKA